VDKKSKILDWFQIKTKKYELIWTSNSFNSILERKKMTKWYIKIFETTLCHQSKLYDNYLYFIFSGYAAQRGLWPPHSWGFVITHNDAPQSVGPLWTSDQPVAETSIWQHTTHTTDKHPCPPVGFEPTIAASERPQTYALDCRATGTGKLYDNTPCNFRSVRNREL
jgi:hypothetical protein